MLRDERQANHFTAEGELPGRACVWEEGDAAGLTLGRDPKCLLQRFQRRFQRTLASASKAYGQPGAQSCLCRLMAVDMQQIMSVVWGKTMLTKM